MNKKLLPSIVLSLSLLAFLNDSPLLMPMHGNLLIVIFIIVYVIYSAFFWKEAARDEREELHILFSGRVAFIVGTTILAFGVIKQAIGHDIDPWLVVALISMVLAKSISRLYSESKN